MRESRKGKYMSSKLRKEWPVLTHYDQQHLRQIALPLGGIGTGTVSLGGRGNLRDWEVMNSPSKGSTVTNIALFVLYAKASRQPSVTRVLEGIVEPPYEGSHGCMSADFSGVPRFRNCEFYAAYPFGQVCLSDPDVPLNVRIEGFNPLVPANADVSGIPVAVLRYVLINKISKTISASVCGSLLNFIGTDGKNGKAEKNMNMFKKSSNVQGLFMFSRGVNKMSEYWGTMALTTTASKVTYKRSWGNEGWGLPLLHFWDNLSEDGKLEDEKFPPQDQPMGSLSASVTIPPYSEREVVFLLTWHFPNRRTWTPKQNKGKGCNDSSCGYGEPSDRIGNYYTIQYRNAWDVARKVAAQLPKLEAETIKFVSAFCNSELPDKVKEAALYNLSTLRTQTCFRTEDGRFYGWEGCANNKGSCHGSCTHVWNYEQATAFLFGELACRMREVEFLHMTNEKGHMSFRVNLPIARALEFGVAAADGQMGCIMKMYRDWQVSGDDGMLKAFWPKVKKSLEFCWCKGGWDADRDGVMEGCQHNTMDVEYYGPNPQMGTWYLGALRAAEEMACYLNDDIFASTCRSLFEHGSKWIDANLFNGEYYEHKIRPIKPWQSIAKGLRAVYGMKCPGNPDKQLGQGCLVDQLVGQYMAHICGLGYLLKKRNIRTTLRSIMKYNFKTRMQGHFNNMRAFALNDEQALLMCSYPKGNRPKSPFPYFNEVMTGFEYVASIHMLYEGQVVNGLKSIEIIRNRYDGRKRNPFNEAECGHHYARAMASWAAVLALTGFNYSGVEQSMRFMAKDGLHFWSNGYAWGTCKQKSVKNGVKVELNVLYGSLKLKRFVLTGIAQVEFKTPKTITAGKTVCWHLKTEV